MRTTAVPATRGSAGATDQLHIKVAQRFRQDLGIAMAR
jgi:hypothetical protein